MYNKYDSIKNGSCSKIKSGMENSNRINQQNIPPSTPVGVPPSKRVLHREDDLLPFSQNSPDFYNNKFSTKTSKISSNITKRHLASNSSTNNNYEDIVKMYASASMSKINKKDENNFNLDKPNRKVAVLTTSNYKAKNINSQNGCNSQNNDCEEFIYDSKVQAAFSAQSSSSFIKNENKGKLNSSYQEKE